MSRHLNESLLIKSQYTVEGLGFIFFLTICFLPLLVASPGIGSGSAPLEQCIELAQRPGVLQHWTSCRHLIIDEVSMVDAQFFDKLESVAR